MSLRIAVLVSGTGSLLEAMLEAGLPIALVISDRPCRGVELADSAGVKSLIHERDDYTAAFDRATYTDQLDKLIAEHDIDVVAMAGFGTVLGESIFESMKGRVINTHPALLPSFPGWHAVADALAAGVKVTGCTIHVATPKVDDGPILAQESVEVLVGDDEAELHERIKTVERRLYIDTLAAIVDRGYVLAPE